MPNNPGEDPTQITSELFRQMLLQARTSQTLGTSMTNEIQRLVNKQDMIAFDVNIAKDDISKLKKTVIEDDHSLKNKVIVIEEKLRMMEQQEQQTTIHRQFTWGQITWGVGTAVLVILWLLDKLLPMLKH